MITTVIALPEMRRGEERSYLHGLVVFLDVRVAITTMLQFRTPGPLVLVLTVATNQLADVVKETMLPHVQISENVSSGNSIRVTDGQINRREGRVGEVATTTSQGADKLLNQASKHTHNSRYKVDSHKVECHDEGSHEQISGNYEDLAHVRGHAHANHAVVLHAEQAGLLQVQVHTTAKRRIGIRAIHSRNTSRCAIANAGAHTFLGILFATHP